MIEPAGASAGPVKRYGLSHTSVGLVGQVPSGAVGTLDGVGLELGVALTRPGGGREIGLALIAHDGLSTQRQFFRRESRYIGGELRFDL